MKLILVWPAGESEVKVLIDELQAAGHEIVYWVGIHSLASACPEGAVFHDHFDAWDAKPADAYKDELFPPPSATLIESMYETESLILTMMNKHYDKAPVDERKHIYYTMLGYWSAILDKLKPDAIVFNDIPHSLYSNVLWDLARKRGVRSVMFEGTLIAGRVLRFENVWEGSKELAAAVRENAKKKLSPDNLGEEIRAYWNDVVSRGGVPIWYIQDQKALTEGVGVAKIRVRAVLTALRTGNLFPLAWNFVKQKFSKNLRHEYKGVVQSADLTRPFVFFAMNFQPERNSSPQGRVFHDQILVAETLAAALPEGWELYIREHPSQWLLRGKTRYTSARYEGYYHRLARIPRVRLVPMDIPVRRLVEASRAIATITGSIGVEAIVWGKKALIFGAAWYRDCPGVEQVRSVEDCSRVFAKIVNGDGARKENALVFLKALEEVSVRTNFGDKVPRMNNEDSMRAFSRSTLDFLGKLR